ncbi:MAG: protein kinase [Acidobacteriota bacterium]
MLRLSMRIFKSPVERADDHYRSGRFEKAAELYVKAGRLDQAAEIYSRDLHDIPRAAEIYELAGKPLEAGRVFEAAEFYREAIAKYQSAGAFRRAAEACLRNSQTLRAASFFEQAEMFSRASECYLDGGEVEGALRALGKESDELRCRRAERSDPILDQRLRLLDLQSAELYQRIGNPMEAARLLAKHGMPEKAAPLFERARDYEAATESFLEAGRETQALRLITEHEEVRAELRAEVYLNASKPHEAATLFEQLGQFAAAATAYEAADEITHAAALWEKDGSHARAAELFSRAERPYDAARCYATSGEHELAAENFARAGSARNAADAYLSADLPIRAAEMYLEAGEPSDALDTLADLAPGHPGYLDACLLLTPLWLDEGEVEKAGECLTAIKEAVKKGGAILDRRYEVLYCQARYLETKGRFRAAETTYAKVLVEQPDYRDAAERLEDMRGRLTADPSLAQAAADQELTGVTRTLEAESHSTQRVRLKPSAASTGALKGSDRESKPPLRPRRGSPRSSSSSSTFSSITEFPAVIQDRLDPWWDGADFLRVTEKSSGEERLMVSFPMALVGERATAFEQITRQLQSLRHDAVLKLEATERASDKVLLFYEAYEDAQTLESALAENRAFTPRGALHLIVQLCEALTRAHKLGLTHQWLSPRTVLIDRENRCKMTGLGLREFLAGENPTSQAYLSPEVTGDGVVGPTSDVYSLGWLAVTLLEAQIPRGKDQYEPGDVRWPSDVEKAVPSSLRYFLVRCLDRDPLARPSTAEMAAALAAIGFIPGQLLDDRYQIVREIGQGGMSRVYSAVDRELGGDVAIKTVLTPALGRTEDEERLYREVQISRRITHTNVVRVHDLGRFPGGIFVIMELLEGPGLDEVIKEEAPLEPARVKVLLSEIAAALGEAHRLQIVHRDLKPGNVILVEGRVKVLDFGIARAKDDTTHLTRTGEVIGSPLYMSPEQIQGQELDGTCDLYALGVMTYTLLTGREPFAADSPTAVVLKHLNEPAPDIRSFLPELDQAWVDVLDRLLAKQPSERFQTADALLDAVADLPI